MMIYFSGLERMSVSILKSPCIVAPILLLLGRAEQIYNKCIILESKSGADTH